MCVCMTALGKSDICYFYPSDFRLCLCLWDQVLLICGIDDMFAVFIVFFSVNFSPFFPPFPPFQGGKNKTCDILVCTLPPTAGCSSGQELQGLLSGLWKEQVKKEK